jgi:hypothetical protein
MEFQLHFVVGVVARPHSIHTHISPVLAVLRLVLQGSDISIIISES